MFVHVVPPLAALEKTPSKAGGTASSVEEERALADAASYLAEVIAAHAGELYGVPTEMDVAFGLTSPTCCATS